MKLFLSSLTLTLVAAVARAGPTAVEAPAPAVAPSGALVEHIGMETLGGVFTPLLEKGCKVPCSVTENFSTASDGQGEIQLSLLRGDTPLAKDAKVIGKFAVVGIRARPRGEPSIAITFTAFAERVSIAAFDNQAKRPLAVVRRGL